MQGLGAIVIAVGLPGAVFARGLIVTGPCVTTCVQVGGVGGPSVEIGCGRGAMVAAETSGCAFGAGWGLASGFGCVAAGALETGTCAAAGTLEAGTAACALRGFRTNLGRPSDH